MQDELRPNDAKFIQSQSMIGANMLDNELWGVIREWTGLINRWFLLSVLYRYLRFLRQA